MSTVSWFFKYQFVNIWFDTGNGNTKSIFKMLVYNFYFYFIFCVLRVGKNLFANHQRMDMIFTLLYRRRFTEKISTC